MHLDTQGDGGQERVLAARLPLWLSIIGVITFAGSAILTARLIWEETVWTWQHGPQMVGFSLAHGGGAILLFFPFLLFLWLIIVLVLSIWSVVKRVRVSKTRWAGLGLSVLLLIVDSLPESFWEQAFIGRMAASPHSGDLLFYAACRGDLGTVRGLIRAGVPANATHRGDSRTALHCAASGGHIPVMQYLASQGANINAVDRSGDSPLESAISNHHEAAAKFLVERGGKRIQGTEEQKFKSIRDQVSEDREGLVNR